jgi:hypothetical protein
MFNSPSANTNLANTQAELAKASGSFTSILTHIQNELPLITDIDPLAGTGNAAIDIAALNKAYSLYNGVRYPNGTYYAALTITKPFIIQGIGTRDNVILQNNSNTAPITIDSSAASISYIWLDNFTVQNVNRSTWPTCNGIVLQSTNINGLSFCSFTRLANFYFNYPFYNNNCSIEWSIWDDIQVNFGANSNVYWSITNAALFPSVNKFSRIRTNGSAGSGFEFDFEETNPTACLLFEQCNPENNQQNGIRIRGAGGVQSLSIFSCYFESNTLSISAGATGPYKANISIESTYCESGCIIGNQFYGTSSGAQLDYNIFVLSTNISNVQLCYGGNMFNTQTVNAVYCPNGGWDIGGNNGQVPPSNVAGGTVTIRNGTFLPTLTIGGVSTGITYSQQRGNYYRLSGMVCVVVNIHLSSKAALTGQIGIAGLPYPAASNSGFYTPVAEVAVDQQVADVNVIGILQDGQSNILLNKSSGGLLTSYTNTDIGNFTTFTLCLTYQHS